MVQTDSNVSAAVVVAAAVAVLYEVVCSLEQAEIIDALEEVFGAVENEIAEDAEGCESGSAYAQVVEEDALVGKQVEEVVVAVYLQDADHDF